MTVYTGVVAYVVIWWLVLFAVLPWGALPPDEPAPGHAAGAPANPRLAFKFAVTTLVAAAIWLAVFAAIRFDLISFRGMAQSVPLQ